MFIVNTPMVFSAAWTIVSPLLPRRTQKKITICSSWSTQSTLQELVDQSELPDFLGGNRTEIFVAAAEKVPAGLELPDTKSLGTIESESSQAKSAEL